MRWVKWRATQEERETAATRQLESMELMNAQLRGHLEHAGREAGRWKFEYERKAEACREQRKRLDAVFADLEALKNAETAAGLSPAEVERLALLSMASAKLAADAAKVILYGWGSPSPHSGRPAYADVERGMGKLAATMNLMEDAGDVRGGDIHAHAGRAKQRIGEQVTRQQ